VTRWQRCRPGSRLYGSTLARFLQRGGSMCKVNKLRTLWFRNSSCPFPTHSNPSAKTNHAKVPHVYGSRLGVPYPTQCQSSEALPQQTLHQRRNDQLTSIFHQERVYVSL
jgi:hypothetical protein